MKSPHTKQIICKLLLAVLIFVTQDAAACTTCVGDADDTQSKGVNAAIFVMLSGLGTLALAIATLFLSFSRHTVNLDVDPANAAEGTSC